MTPNITGPEGADARRWRSRPTGHTAQEQATSPGGAGGFFFFIFFKNKNFKNICLF